MARKKKPSPAAHLEVIPLGRVDTLAVSIVAANLQTVMGLNADILPPVPEPEYAYLPLRTQYSAGKILCELESLGKGARFKLGVVDLDICSPILKFLFGESQLGGRAALVSLHRLAHDEPRLLYERAAKIGLHETAHLLGIGHCRAKGCLMAFSSNVEKLDSLPLRFCSACEYEVSRSLKNTFGGNTPFGVDVPDQPR